ncbi:hypothetical protein [Pseudomonas sp. W5-36]|uniref:hypothetical protein n=1 Tax=Pseudomonas sp. W5-36 TaxID=3097455 RepID=UPI003978F09A
MSTPNLCHGWQRVRGCSDGAKVKGFAESEKAQFVTSSVTAAATVGRHHKKAMFNFISCTTGRRQSPISINSYSIVLRLSGLDDSSFGLFTFFTLWLDAWVTWMVILEL